MARGMWIDFGRLLGKAFVLGIAVGLVLTLAAAALPSPLQEEEAQAESPRLATSGRFLMRRASGEGWTMAPNLATEASFRVAGVVARATVRQRFQNATDGWVEGVYVFPLPENAAVDHLLMKVGEREIEGQIREREQAKAEYQQAKSEGKKASLVEQERPNLFTTSVANLGPGETLVVEIEFQQTLSFDEGEVRLRLPLVVGPRYIPGQATDEKPFGLGWALDTDLVPDASRVTPPLVKAGAPLRNPVSIEVELDPGFPLQSLVSRYHAVVSQPMPDGRYHVKLKDELVPADGVYITRTKVGDELFDSVTNVGNRPTFGVDSFAIESHLLNFHPVDVLAQTRVELCFLHRLRDEVKFPSVDALREQIARDVKRARRYFRLLALKTVSD